MSLSLPRFSRRDLLAKGSKLSLASFALVSGLNVKAFADEKVSTNPQDIDILNEILGTEHEGIAAYQVFFDDGILQKSAIKTAKVFQNHHKQHRDILIDQIKKIGGEPSAAKALGDYKDDLSLGPIKDQQTALQVLLILEMGAANGYIGMLPATNDREMTKIAGRIAADEVMHWTVWATRLNISLPTQALSFGA
jgi:bacterioferritin (cytochrome b1)